MGGVRERLPLWVQTRCGLRPRALAALAVVLVAGVTFAVQQFWVGRPQGVRAPELVGPGALELASPSSAAPPGGRPGARIVVDVSGEVRRPGVFRLPSGSRVTDALGAAGGVLPKTDVTGLNRARVLMDGEHVVVGTPPQQDIAPAGPSPTPGSGVQRPGTAPLSLNTATLEQLDTLPGVGPVLARHILDYRDRHGGFRSLDELREVDGIGERRFADLSELVRP
ncbi:helix-hairpin-helix domain-containing protein [Streptomyces sp. NPDC057638]|uniref:helix-hairpin-helix domain-containing protein n=1 Tax=Streptomyces sp. NPDC057638 TaxID=3346190 RepID=UPI0036857B82